MTGSVDSVEAERRFGVAVRQAREQLGLSQEGLATMLKQQIGVNVGGQSGMARIERGARPTRLNEVVAISKFLSIDLSAVYSPEERLLTEEGINAGQAELEHITKELARLAEVGSLMETARDTLVAAKGALERRRSVLTRALALGRTYQTASESARMELDMVLAEMDVPLGTPVNELPVRPTDGQR